MPLGSTEPLSVAVVAPATAAPVIAVGGSSVVKLTSSPLTSPSLFVATRRTWYGVPRVRSLTAALTACAVMPDSAEAMGVARP